MSKQKYHRAPLALAISSTLAVSATQAAVITVDTLADPGAPAECSLRSAIEAINTLAPSNGCPAGDGVNDEIIFDSTVTGNIELNGGILSVYDDVAITGPGAADLSIDGLGTSGLFYIQDPGLSITLSGLTLTNGYSDFGGAIYLSGQDTRLGLTDCVVSGNEATDNGGGIEVFGGSRLYVSNCTFEDNVAAENGGAVAVTEGYARIESSTILNNIAALGGGAQVNFYRPIEPPPGEEPSELNASLVVADSLVMGNSATYGGGLGAGYYAEPVLLTDPPNQRSLITGADRGSLSPQNLVVIESSITMNDAYLGGGLAAIPPFSSPIILGGSPGPDSGLANRFVLQNSGIYENSADIGGGVSSVYSGMSVYGGEISLNEAQYSGGGVFSATTLPAFGSGEPGLEETYLIIDGAAVVDNEVLSTPLRGGALYDARAAGGGLSLIDTNAYLVDSDLASNAAPRLGGGVFAQLSRFSAAYSRIDQNIGGGLYGDAAVLRVAYSRVTRNEGGLDSGAGGLQCESTSVCEVKYSEVSENIGATVGGIGANLRDIVESPTLDLLNVTVSGNVGTSIGGIRAERLNMEHSTVAFNEVLAAPLPRGVFIPTAGGLSTSDQSVVANSIVAYNAAGSGSSDINLESGTLLMDYTLVGDATGLTFSGAGNLLDADPLLVALDLNGGDPRNGRTHALNDGSPALDAGLAPSPPGFDQRGEGFDRISGPGLDMGAFELQIPLPDVIFSDRFESP